MDKYEYYKKCIVIGDKVKYKFLKKIINDSLDIKYAIDELEEYDICVFYSDKPYMEVYEEERHLEIAIPTMEVGELLFIAKNIYDEYSFGDYIKFGDVIEKLLVVAAFPYNKRDLLEQIDELEKEIKIGETKVIFYKESRKFGYTDLQNEEECIELAKKEFMKNGIKTIIVEDEDRFDYSRMILSELNLEDSFKSVYTQQFIRAKKNFNSKFDRTYDVFVKGNFTDNCTALDTENFKKYNQIFSYNILDKSKKIWQNYIDEFEKRYLLSEFGIFQDCLNLQDDFTREIAFWSENESINELRENILDKYHRAVVLETDTEVPKTEIEYLMFKNKGSICLDFKFDEKIRKFIDVELRAVVKEFIGEKLNKLKLEGEE